VPTFSRRIEAPTRFGLVLWPPHEYQARGYFSPAAGRKSSVVVVFHMSSQMRVDSFRGSPNCWHSTRLSPPCGSPPAVPVSRSDDDGPRGRVRAFAVPVIASAGVRRCLNHAQSSRSTRTDDRGRPPLLLPAMLPIRPGDTRAAGAGHPLADARRPRPTAEFCSRTSTARPTAPTTDPRPSLAPAA
jgi:hypothetical protein